MLTSASWWRHGGSVREFWTTLCSSVTFPEESKRNWHCAMPLQSWLSSHKQSGRSSSTNGQDSYLLPALGNDGSSWLSSEVRAAARTALLKRDVQQNFVLRDSVCKEKYHTCVLRLICVRAQPQGCKSISRVLLRHCTAHLSGSCLQAPSCERFANS